MQNLIDAQFNAAQSLKTFEVNERLLAAISLPTYYRTDASLPPLRWFVATDCQLALIGDDYYRAFPLSRLTHLDFTQAETGISTISLRGKKESVTLHGYFPGQEKTFVDALQYASASLTPTIPLQSFFQNPVWRLGALNAFMAIAIFLCWMGILKIWNLTN